MCLSIILQIFVNYYSVGAGKFTSGGTIFPHSVQYQQGKPAPDKEPSESQVNVFPQSGQ